MTLEQFRRVTSGVLIEEVAEFLHRQHYPDPAKALADEYLDKAMAWVREGMAPLTYTYDSGWGSRRQPLVRWDGKTRDELDDTLWTFIGNYSEDEDEAERGHDEARYMGDSDRDGN